MQQVKNTIEKPCNPVESHELVMYLLDDYLNQYIETVTRDHDIFTRAYCRASFKKAIPEIKELFIQGDELMILIDELIDDYNTYISNEKLFLFMNC